MISLPWDERWSPLRLKYAISSSPVGVSSPQNSCIHGAWGLCCTLSCMTLLKLSMRVREFVPRGERLSVVRCSSPRIGLAGIGAWGLWRVGRTRATTRGCPILEVGLLVRCHSCQLLVSPCYTCGICPGVGCGICHWGGSIPLWLWVRLGQSLWYLGYQWMRPSNLLLLHERGSNFLGRRVVPLPMIEVNGHFSRLLLAWFACSFIINYHGYVTAGW